MTNARRVGAAAPARDTLNRAFDDFAIGDRFRSAARTVTEADIVGFAGLSADFTAIHVDAMSAADSIFRGRVAHGLLTLSLASGLEFLLMGPGQSHVLAFYGLDRVRLIQPVRIGDTISLEGEVVDLQPRGADSGLVRTRQAVKNQSGETVVSLEKLTLYRRRT